MVPGAGLEPARGCPREILSLLRLPISPSGLYITKITSQCCFMLLKTPLLHKDGGWSRNRTGVHGVAVRCITTLPSSLKSRWSGKGDRPGWRSSSRPSLALPRYPNWSGKGDSNSRPSPWQGDALPLSYSRSTRGRIIRIATSLSINELARVPYLLISSLHGAAKVRPGGFQILKHRPQR